MGIQGKRSAWSHEGCEDEKISITKIQRSKRESTKISRLKCFYVNARSVVNKDKRTELELYVDKEKPDVIGITESWAKKSIKDSELELDGYIMFRKDREIHGGRGHGGGVLLYIKDNLMAFERTDLKDDRFKESVWCKIKNKNEKMVIGLCYRPPDSSKENDIGLHELINSYHRCMHHNRRFQLSYRLEQEAGQKTIGRPIFGMHG